MLAGEPRLALRQGNAQVPVLLLIEDDDCDAAAFLRAFRKAGLSNPIRRIFDGRAALDHLRERDEREARKVIILLDLNLPRMNGHEFLTELRKDPALRQAAVFVMTTSHDRGDVARAYDHNVAGYILKDGSAPDLTEFVRFIGEYAELVLLPDVLVGMEANGGSG
ncbi:response regulator [Citreicella sp. C3M06]|uniref:response regulator n=1 Tax=Citreicella sp. C3M06 TaxID=2841564 RepID=UPI001C09185F|nr:response regulator [Citreicella sp. C3M06]MBU2961126.1 response regulator [Citreicella sp. C3M06]